MGSRREEERNEKIIRGLMKLPPNRRCLNCNSLGPQYVCTTFWTFVCMACSGIHREFTHRVKSVSMAKFTSQEVEALQNGGNQRAREMYLKNWDYQRQRQPDNSNADRVREFIRNVYVEKKYAGGNPSDKPPRGNQTHRSYENVTRRPDSYHSYSQSPPYDYQYEERRYGKLPLGFTSKSASEKGLHAKASSFAFSPGRFRDHMFEEQFATEGSAPRASDFSVSSRGDPFRSEIESPNFQKEVGFSSPRFQYSDVPSNENLHPTTNLFPDGQHQRSTSFGSARSFDSNSMSVKSCNSSGLVDGVPENDQNTGSLRDKTSTPAPSSAYEALDLSGAPVASDADSTKHPSIDLFQLPGAPVAQPVNTFHPSTVAQSPLVNSYQPPLAYPSTSTNLIAEIVDHHATLQPPELSVPKNIGWATFDNPVSAAQPTTGNITFSGFQFDNSSVKIEGISQPSASMQWPLYPSNPNQPTLSIPSPWDDDLCDGPETSVSAGNLHLQEEAWQHVNIQKEKSTNPFDLPNDPELELNDMFLDMSSLQAALPSIQPPATFCAGVTQPWFAADFGPSLLPPPAAAQGGLAYMAGQASTSQLQTVVAQEPVASTGGNPFA